MLRSLFTNPFDSFTTFCGLVLVSARFSGSGSRRAWARRFALLVSGCRCLLLVDGVCSSWSFLIIFYIYMAVMGLGLANLDCLFALFVAGCCSLLLAVAWLLLLVALCWPRSSLAISSSFLPSLVWAWLPWLAALPWLLLAVASCFWLLLAALAWSRLCLASFGTSMLFSLTCLGLPWPALVCSGLALAVLGCC